MARAARYYHNHEFGRDNFIIFPTRLLLILDHDAAYTLARLMDLGKFLEMKRETRDDFFRCSNRFTVQGCFNSDRSNYRIMQLLEHRGYIERQMMGNPAKRWIRINFEAISLSIKNTVSVRDNLGDDYDWDDALDD